MILATSSLLFSTLSSHSVISFGRTFYAYEKVIYMYESSDTFRIILGVSPFLNYPCHLPLPLYHKPRPQIDLHFVLRRTLDHLECLLTELSARPLLIPECCLLLADPIGPPEQVRLDATAKGLIQNFSFLHYWNHKK